MQIVQTKPSGTRCARARPAAWFVALGVGYLLLRRNPEHAALRALHEAKVREEHRQKDAAAEEDSVPVS